MESIVNKRLMSKKIIITILLFICNQYSYSQLQAKHRTKRVKGYLVWELRHEKNFGSFKLISIYFLNSDRKYSRLPDLFPGLDLCGEDVEALKAMEKNKKTGIEYYDFHRDTALNVPVPNMLITGSFYTGFNGNLYMVNKLSAKVILIDSLCKEFENSQVFSSVCGTPFLGPYIYFLENRTSKPIKKRDSKKLKLTTNAIKEIVFIECY